MGWRGFALPRLQKRSTALVSTLIVGVLWALWHTPLFFVVGNPMASYPYTYWFAFVLGLSVIFTWLYNNARGSVLIVALLHVGINTVGAMMLPVSMYALAGVSVLIGVAILVRSRSKAYTSVGPTTSNPQMTQMNAD